MGNDVMNARTRRTSHGHPQLKRLGWVAVSMLWFCMAGVGGAQEASICAEVQMEIRQELTLERQAFDAMMRINNGVEHLSVEDVNVDVRFWDQDNNLVTASSDPNDTNALFYIAIDSLQNISNVGGSGAVAGGTSAEIHWLIIPATGAGGPDPLGARYFVGAELSYTLGGEPHVVDVSPDYIFVKPLPELTLQVADEPDANPDDRHSWFTIGKLPGAEASQQEDEL